MPPGITDVLSRRDFVDLARFLTELGKSPGFRVPTRETVRVWQALQSDTPITANQLVDGNVNVDSGTWSPAFSRADGSLPLDELQTLKLDGKDSFVVQFQLDVHQAGKVGLQIDSRTPHEVWIDGRLVLNRGQQLVADVKTGSHRVVLAIKASNGAAPPLRVERLDLPESSARFAFKLEP